MKWVSTGFGVVVLALSLSLTVAVLGFLEEPSRSGPAAAPVADGGQSGDSAEDRADREWQRNLEPTRPLFLELFFVLLVSWLFSPIGAGPSLPAQAGPLLEHPGVAGLSGRGTLHRIFLETRRVYLFIYSGFKLYVKLIILYNKLFIFFLFSYSLCSWPSEFRGIT